MEDIKEDIIASGRECGERKQTAQIKDDQQTKVGRRNQAVFGGKVKEKPNTAISLLYFERFVFFFLIL